MPISPFVSPDIHRIELDDGLWFDHKVELGVAESKRLETSAVTGLRAPGMSSATTPEEAAAGAEMALDWGRFYLTKLEVYLVDWNFKDPQGKPVKCTTHAIHSLRPEMADLIINRLNEWLDQRDRGRQADPTTTTDSESRSA